MVELVDAPHSKCGTFGFVGSSPTAPTAVMETYNRFPLTIVKGKGCWVWDKNNNLYLDAVAGIATCTLGHSNRAMRRALIKQLKKIQHVSNLYQIPEQEELAKWLVKNSCADKAFFCNSGAEANEAAIKLVRKYSHCKLGIDKPLILSAKASFHGRTLGALSATGQTKYHKGFEPLFKGFEFFSYNDYRSFEKLLHRLEDAKESVAAVLIEPIQGEGGVNPGNQVFFKQLRKICNEKNILLILDEVQSGMGRCGSLWGYEQLGIEPDAFTTAKGLGGGHPIGALLVKHKADFFDKGDHASTFGGNPFACQAALTVANEIERKNLIYNVNCRGKQLKDGLQLIIEKFPKKLNQVRGFGLIQGLVIREDIELTAIDITHQAMKEKLLVVPAGEKVVRIVPPLNIKKNEINELLKRLEKALVKH